jgi:predicted nucleotidyltransferase
MKISKLIKAIMLIEQANDDLKRLVEPVVREDIRVERSKLNEAVELIKTCDED